MPIGSLDTALYRIELPVPLSDSTHGTMTHFELVTVRLRDSDGAEASATLMARSQLLLVSHSLLTRGREPS
jgi:hypothetical protein